MSHKEKADEIFDKISWAMVPDGQSVRTDGIIKHAKQCAIICVEQIIEELKDILDITGSSYVREEINQWNKVIEHIKNS